MKLEPRPVSRVSKLPEPWVCRQRCDHIVVTERLLPTSRKLVYRFAVTILCKKGSGRDRRVRQTTAILVGDRYSPH